MQTEVEERYVDMARQAFTSKGDHDVFQPEETRVPDVSVSTQTEVIVRINIDYGMTGQTFEWSLAEAQAIHAALTEMLTDFALPGTELFKDTRPHSRACGIRKHDHGRECHSNCPTCRGVDSIANMDSKSGDDIFPQR